jgi:hypothetical protein
MLFLEFSVQPRRDRCAMIALFRGTFQLDEVVHDLFGLDPVALRL